MGSDAGAERRERGPAVHAAALVGPSGIVFDEIGVERHLHLVDGLEPSLAALDAEVLVQQGPVQALDDAVGLRPLHPGLAMLDVIQLEEEFVGVLVLAPAELASVVRQHRLDGRPFGLEGRQHVLFERRHGGDRQLVQVEPRPGVAAVAVDGGVEIDLPHAFQHADEEGVNGHQRAGVRHFDVPLVVFGAEPLQEANLLVGQGDRPLGRDRLQP